MTTDKPLVSIGLPVYNAERYLEQAIDSILAQTFGDFELIISDNASTDRTREICEAYASRDSRVRYVPHDVNRGAAWNFNHTVELARGEYFRWAAHDDLVEPTYLERCMAILQARPDILVCHTKVRIVDEDGEHVTDYDDMLHFESDSPRQRFREYLFRPARMWSAVFGVIRTDEFRKTALLGAYPCSDQPLVGEMVLRGKVYQVPERLFIRRRHPEQSWQANRKSVKGGFIKRWFTGNDGLAAWWDPNNKKKFVPPLYVKLAMEYLSDIHRVPLGLADRLWCYGYVARWASKRFFWRPLKMRFVSAARREQLQSNDA